jgi:hypothetical protein
VGGTIKAGVAPEDGCTVAQVLLERPDELKGTGQTSMVVLHVEAAADGEGAAAVAAAGRPGSAGPSGGRCGRGAEEEDEEEGEEEGEEEELLRLEAAALRRAVAAAGECGVSGAGAGKPPRPSNSSHIITLHAEGLDLPGGQRGEGAGGRRSSRPSNTDSEASLMSRQSSLPEGELCTICFERAASCVFLECGHGGVCKRCGYLLFVRPPNECPHCRQRIEQVVQVSRSAKVGELAKVS